MLLSFGFLDEKQFIGAWLKSRRDERPQTGVNPPVVVRQQKKPRRGDRDRCKLKLNKLDILSPLLGFCFVDAPLPGACAPVCGLSGLRPFSPDNISRLNVRNCT